MQTTLNKIYFKLIIRVIFIFSCDKVFLDIQNPNDLNSASFWSSEEELQMGLVATYAALQLDGMLGGSAAFNILFVPMLVDPIIGMQMQLTQYSNF